MEICELKNKNPWVEFIPDAVQEITFAANDLEIILPTRVPEENFLDVLNLFRASYKVEGSDRGKALVSIEYI